jgi:hypothetical protein
MSSDLSIFAARLRDFIGICSEDSLYAEASSDPALKAHFDVEFNGLALVLFALQFSNNPAYRRFGEARQVFPNSVTHWTQIPAVPTSAFKELELTSLAPEQRTAVFHSSGTTGRRPSRHFHSTESLEIYEASLWPWFSKNLGLAIGDWRFAILTPQPSQVPHSSLVHMFETIRRKLNLSGSVFLGKVAADDAWILDFAGTVATLRESVDRKRPLILLGTAFSFVHLLDHLTERNLRFELPVDSRVMETGGYKGRSRTLLKAELHQLISEHLGIPATNISCEYGMSELSSQAYDSRSTSQKPRCFLFPPWARAQVISPETGREVADGETGLIRIFDLANVFSAMAVQTEDLAIRWGEGFELIGRAELAEQRGCSLMSFSP